METKEIFKDIPGYEGYYQVSNMGRVRSLDRTVVDSRGGERFYKGRVIQGHINKTTGYRQVGLTISGERRTLRVSQIAAVVFLGHIPDGHTFVVDHVNGNKSDDILSNLRIVTNRENTTTCFRKNRKTLSSKFTGVSWGKHAKKWQAHIQYEGALTYLGCYDNELEASEAYQNALAKIEDGTFDPDDYKPVYASRYKGVTFNKANSKWRADIQYEGKLVYLGCYDNELEAYQAYQDALVRIEDGTFNVNDYKPNYASRYKGVTFNKRRKKWVSYTRVNDKQKYIGIYPTELEAYEALQKFKEKQPSSI